MSIHHVLDHAAIGRVLRGPGVRRDIFRRSHRVRGAAQRYAGVDSGQLRASLGVEMRLGAVSWIGKIGSRVRHARVHHEGHGVIVPVRAKALRFKPKGSRTWVFAMRVRAVKGTKYLTRALPFARG